MAFGGFVGTEAVFGSVPWLGLSATVGYYSERSATAGSWSVLARTTISASGSACIDRGIARSAKSAVTAGEPRGSLHLSSGLHLLKVRSVRL